MLGDAEVLDLFAGSGACGIEAISRGARSAVFVDSDARACKLISQNLADLDMEGEVIRRDALRFLSSPHRFDLAIVDPPYAFDKWHELLGMLVSDLIVCESGQPFEVPDQLSVVQQRNYGGTVITILERTS